MIVMLVFSLYKCLSKNALSLSAILFQCHEKHQYPIRDHGKSCRAGPLSCARSFTDSLHHVDSGGYKFRPLMVYHSENIRACYTFLILRVFDTRGNSQERYLPRITRVTCSYKMASISFIYDLFNDADSHLNQLI
jgi:hypothetical protein